LFQTSKTIVSSLTSNILDLDPLQHYYHLARVSGDLFFLSYLVLQKA